MCTRLLSPNLPPASFLFVFLLIRQANIADYGDNQWVTCFQESAEAILGQNAAYLGQLKDSVRLVFLKIILAKSPGGPMHNIEYLEGRMSHF